MARKYFLVSPLILVAGLIAMVRAQDGGRRMTLDRPGLDEPAILQVAGDDGESTRSVLRKAPQRTAGLGERFQSSRRPSTAPPDAPAEFEVDQGSGASPEPLSAQPSNGEMPGDVPSVLKRKLNKSGTPQFAPQEAGPAASGPAPASLGGSGSSRRTAGLPRATPAVPPTEYADEPASPATGGAQDALPAPPGREPFSAPDAPQMRAPQATSGALISSVGPALRVEMTGPKALVIGKPATYVVSLVNDGAQPAADVFVRLAVPPWAIVAATSTTAGTAQTQDEGAGQTRFVWSVGQVEGRGRHQLQLQVVARESRPFELGVDWAFRPMTATAQIEVQQPQLEMAIAGQKDVPFGANLTYVITIANPGNGDAENVSVRLTAGSGAPEMIQVGLIPAGQQKQIEVQLAASQAGVMKLIAAASGDGNLQAEVAEQILVRRANLQIAASGPKLKFAGAEGAYQFQVSNTGDAAAEDVSATITLPPGAKITALTDGGKQSVNGVTWRIGSLAPNTERVYEVRCELAAAGENRIEIRSQGAGGLTAAEAVVTRVEALADLKLTVNEPKGPRTISEDATYELLVVNRGTKAAEDVLVVVHFSEGLDPIGADGAQAELVAGQAAFQPISRIEAGQQLVLKVRARADRPGNHRYRAELQCKEPETHLLSEGTTRFFGDDAAPRAATAPKNSTGAVAPRSVVPESRPVPTPVLPVSTAGKKR